MSEYYIPFCSRCFWESENRKKSENDEVQLKCAILFPGVSEGRHSVLEKNANIRLFKSI